MWPASHFPTTHEAERVQRGVDGKIVREIFVLTKPINLLFHANPLQILIVHGPL